MKILTRILWGLFLAVMPFVLYGYTLSLWRVVTEQRGHESQALAFGAGAALFFVAYRLTRFVGQRPWNYLATLEHELTHALVGLLFLKIPVSWRVTAYEGGHVRLLNGTNVWISLAPYYLPTLSLSVLLANYLLWQSVATAFYVVLGATVAFHLWTTWQETSFRQPDLQEAGWLASCLILPVMNLLCYGSLAGFVAGGAAGIELFWRNGGHYAGAALAHLWAALSGGGLRP